MPVLLGGEVDEFDGESGFAGAAGAGDDADGDGGVVSEPLLEGVELGLASDEGGGALVGEEEVQLGAWGVGALGGGFEGELGSARRGWAEGGEPAEEGFDEFVLAVGVPDGEDAAFA